MQPEQRTTVWAWEKTVVILKQPGPVQLEDEGERERRASERVCAAGGVGKKRTLDVHEEGARALDERLELVLAGLLGGGRVQQIVLRLRGGKEGEAKGGRRMRVSPVAFASAQDLGKPVGGRACVHQGWQRRSRQSHVSVSRPGTAAGRPGGRDGKVAMTWPPSTGPPGVPSGRFAHPSTRATTPWGLVQAAAPCVAGWRTMLAE